MALTCDNADNNSMMITALEKDIPGYRGHNMRVRCFGHVLNLVVKVHLLLSDEYSSGRYANLIHLQAILAQFSCTRTAKKANGNKAPRTAFDAVLHDLDDPAEEVYELFFEEDLIPEDSEDGKQTDEARDEADEEIIDEIVEEQDRALVISKEDVVAGKKALEKVHP